MFTAQVESIYGIIRGIVRIDNPFLTYFLLKLRYVVGIFQKYRTFSLRSKLSDTGKMLVIYFDTILN